jgi:hypothetical protein
MRKNARHRHRIAAGAVAQLSRQSINGAVAAAKMAALQNSVCDFDFQVEIGFFWCGNFTEIFVSVNFLFKLTELHSAFRVFTPKLFQRAALVKYGWKLFSYPELGCRLVLHNCEVSSQTLFRQFIIENRNSVWS